MYKFLQKQQSIVLTVFTLFFLQFTNLSSLMAQIIYPVTNKGDVSDTYFNTKVNDPYRWLEDDRSVETGNWVTAQNNVTFDYLKKIPSREKFQKAIE